ncbi:uncharacterized protein LOC132722675 [Ruditapes philippinarum]|uniref:uncharacterized protein LOC132722675 n=1 Tax=Ruditapes philippinarum TaxID=129788 RepID=UPI00295B1F4A|nr:uncharacterized protein LOC132722675 [Ruditapes philippinarum]
MGKHSVSIMTTYVLFAICLLIHKTSAVENTEIDSENINDRDQELSTYILEKQMYNLLKDNQRLLQYIALHEPDHTENPRFKRQSVAGLDNLDLMTKMLGKTMVTGTSLSDMQKLMLKMGRRR